MTITKVYLNKTTTLGDSMFSPANAKIKALAQVPQLARWVAAKRKIYSFDLLSGWSCPFAKDCLSKVHMINGKRKLKDGPQTLFRCFSASQEATFTGVFNKRKSNWDKIRACKSTAEMVELIEEHMPANLGICRIHVAGDFFNQMYFDAWTEVAANHTDRLFYAYTKSLNFWLNRWDWYVGQGNMIMTASRGGRLDHLIDSEGLREAIVVYSPEQAANLGLEIDHTDEHAAIPEQWDKSFALLIHGAQPAGSEASEAIKQLKQRKVKFAYS